MYIKVNEENLVIATMSGKPLSKGYIKITSEEASKLLDFGNGAEYSYNHETCKVTKVSEAVEEPTEEELITAELLLNQADIMAKQAEQDEVLAEILLNQMEV